jgi:dTDP-4-dehydrorhamnose 3,5-epimerase
VRFVPTALPEVVLIEPQVHGDERGFFMETWHRERFARAGIACDFVQDNHSRSVRGTLRGLHFQLERVQGKLARVTAGEVFDVAVDVRRSSPTFGRWVGTRLSAANRHSLWLPPGFAHGFLVLSEFADFVYKCTDYYDPVSERAVLWNDPAIGIEWPLESGAAPILSAKDAAAQPLARVDCLP